MFPIVSFIYALIKTGIKLEDFLFTFITMYLGICIFASIIYLLSSLRWLIYVRNLKKMSLQKYRS